MTLRHALPALAALLTAIAYPSFAYADASVMVRITDSAGRPIDGTVTLHGQGGARVCTTTAGRCTLSVPAGSYTASMAPVRGAAPPPRTIAVPPTGSITLALTANDAPPSPSRPMAPPVSMGRPQQGVVNQPLSPTAGRPGAVISPTPQPAPVPGRPMPTASPVGAQAAPIRTPTVQQGPPPNQPPSQSGGSGRPLGAGAQLVAQGSILDGQGRPVDGTLTLRAIPGNTVVGQVTTTAGRFSLFDLPHGTYNVTIQSARGTQGTGVIVIAPGVARPTLRVP